jgi:hypothetical protein
MMFRGGSEDGAFAFTYRIDAIDDAEARTLLETIQAGHNAATGLNFSILQLGNLVVNELQVLHDDCLQSAWY